MNKHKKYNKRNFKLIIAISIGFIVLVSLHKTFIWGSYVPTDSLIIENVVFDDYYMKLNGNTSNSALAYSGCNYHWEGSTLYIKPRYALVNIIHSSGKFEISDGGPFEGIQAVYIQGKEANDKKLIWSR